MEAGQLWKEEITLHEKEFKDVELEHMLADNWDATFKKSKAI